MIDTMAVTRRLLVVFNCVFMIRPVSGNSCFQNNTGFYDPLIILNNAGAYPNPSSCQKSCQANPSCTHFSWTDAGEPGKAIGVGACFVFGATATLVEDKPGYLSGPKECPTIVQLEATTTAASATAQMVTTTAVTTTIAGTSVAGMSLRFVLPSAVVAVIACGIVAYCCMRGQSKQKPKTKRSTKVVKSDPRHEMPTSREGSRAGTLAVTRGENMALLRPPTLVAPTLPDHVPAFESRVSMCVTDPWVHNQQFQQFQQQSNQQAAPSWASARMAYAVAPSHRETFGYA